jgi:hypothetical protein
LAVGAYLACFHKELEHYFLPGDVASPEQIVTSLPTVDYVYILTGEFTVLRCGQVGMDVVRA